MTISKLCLLASLTALTACSHIDSQQTDVQHKKAEPLFHWVQYGESGKVFFRAITEARICPDIQIDQNTLSLNVRAPSNSEFKNLVCEIEIPQNTKSVEFFGHAVKLPKENPKKFLFIGNTGCAPNASQSANTNCAFSEIARTALNWNPDLIVHLGDYAQPTDRSEKNWNENFYTPAQSLLENSIWIFARGNNEGCAHNAYKGWFRALSPFSYTTQTESNCIPHEASVKVPLSRKRSFLLLDSSAPEYSQADLEAIPSSEKMKLWVLAHLPLFEDLKDLKKIKKLNHDIEVAFSSDSPGIIISKPKNHIPPEITVGNGGNPLDESNLKVSETVNARGTSKIEYRDFGFLTLEEIRSHVWTLVARDRTGRSRIHCEMTEHFGKDTELKCY